MKSSLNINRALLSFLIILAPHFLKAQTSFNVYNDGLDDFVLESGLTATIFGGYVSQTNTNDGTIDNQSTIQLTGDWANNNSGATNVFLTSTGTVELIGTTEQTISGTATTSFYDLTINNTSASGGVTISTTVDVSNALTLTDGIVTTSSGNTIVMNAGSSSGSGSAASYVDGPMRKEGTTAFTFPLGDGGIWARLAIGVPSSTTTFEAQYIRSGFSNTTTMISSPTPILNNVSTIEYWNLTQFAGTGTATVELYWENATSNEITDCPDLKLARWSGGGWENTYNTSGSGTCTGSGSGSISSSAAVTSFIGPFTFGSLVSGVTNPLPIELLSFDAKLNKTVVELSWSTASEFNNDFFTVERSFDLQNFDQVLTVEGAGTSTELITYEAIDENPYAGVSYYRLIQKDFDGTSTRSGDLVRIQNDVFDKYDVVVYPNPLGDSKLFINLSKFPVNQTASITIHDMFGKRVFTQIVPSGGLSSRTIEIQLGNQFSGVYLMTLSSGSIQVKKKLVIN